MVHAAIGAAQLRTGARVGRCECRVRDTGAGWRPADGISQGSAHLQTRSQCVADFTAAFSGIPLARSLWTHPDAWLLMISPPLDSLYQLYHSAPSSSECRCVRALVSCLDTETSRLFHVHCFSITRSEYGLLLSCPDSSV